VYSVQWRASCEEGGGSFVDEVLVTTADGGEFWSEFVIVTVPLGKASL
jgi:hypothetical protein